MSNTKKSDSGAAEGARRATEQSPESCAAAGSGRWSAKRKVSVILELLRGADIELTSRKYRVTIATLTEWRDLLPCWRRGDPQKPRGGCGKRGEAAPQVGGGQHQRR